MDEPLLNINISQLAATFDLHHFGNELLLFDNMDEEKKEYCIEQLSIRYPVKLSFTGGVMCLSGTITVRVNLREFTLQKNDFMYLHENTIFELVGVSDDMMMMTMLCTRDFWGHVVARYSSIQMALNVPIVNYDSETAEELVTIYKLMRRTIVQTGNPQRKNILLGYMQVLSGIGLAQIQKNYRGG